jgi:hypothetical protein
MAEIVGPLQEYASHPPETTAWKGYLAAYVSTTMPLADLVSWRSMR